MKYVVTALIVAVGLAFTIGLQAADPAAAEELARRSNCMACHTIDKNLIGPAFKEISAKYKGQKDAAAMLGDKVKKGSTGVWGQIPMPPNGQVGDEDIKTLVEWMLAN